jgi:hypothetical protein
MSLADRFDLITFEVKPVITCAICVFSWEFLAVAEARAFRLRHVAAHLCASGDLHPLTREWRRYDFVPFWEKGCRCMEEGKLVDD